MKKIIPYLLLCGLLYGGWYYWQQLPKPRLVAKLLPHNVADIDRLIIQPEGSISFELSKTADGWIVEGQNRSFSSPEGKAEALVNALLGLRSSGLSNNELPKDPVLDVQISGPEVVERIQFYPTPDSLPKYSAFVKINQLADNYLVENIPINNLPIHFQDYRNHLLLDLRTPPRLDSLVWWQTSDSSRTVLLKFDSPDSLTLDSLQNEWNPKMGQHFADFFGEIQHANKLLGRYLIYGKADTIPATIEVYYHHQWPQPFVLKGMGPEYFAVDSLGILPHHQSVILPTVDTLVPTERNN